MLFRGECYDKALVKPVKHEERVGERGEEEGGGGWVEGVGAVDTKECWDTGGLDVEDPGVCDLTVDLHHHLKLLVLYNGVCNSRQSNKTEHRETIRAFTKQTHKYVTMGWMNQHSTLEKMTARWILIIKAHSTHTNPARPTEEYSFTHLIHA